MIKKSTITQLPDADRIQGVHVLPAASPRLTVVALQYTSAHTGLCEVRMPLLDALYLANVLEAMIRDNGYETLRRPPTT